MTDHETVPTEKTETKTKKTKQRAATRKSVWVCIPIEYEEVAVADPGTGDLVARRQPTKYALTECPGGNGQKKAILAALARHEIDPLNYDDVLMFRATPLDFKIGRQLIVRF